MPRMKETKNLLKQAKLAADRLPPSRESSMVKTKIDEAILWLGEVPGEFGPAVGTLKD